MLQIPRLQHLLRLWRKEDFTPTAAKSTSRGKGISSLLSHMELSRESHLTQAFTLFQLNKYVDTGRYLHSVYF